MAHRVYIDGHAGTTGLRIRQWLAAREDLEVINLPEAQRKDEAARQAEIAACDVAVLCLPDEAARNAAGWATEAGTKVLDASTAHRVSQDWAYGLPELAPGQRQAISEASLVSNPGCYPSGVVLLLRPLIDAGLLPASTPVAVHALSGYSGGGRPMIERWESPTTQLSSLPYEVPYSLDRVHKHIPEMRHYSGLEFDPVFVPAVGAFRCGMRVQIPLHLELLSASATGKDLWEVLAERYRDEPFVNVEPIREPVPTDEHAFEPLACNDTNRMDLHVLPHPGGHVLLMAVLDNLGKGASGAAIQNLNLMLGLDETAGLTR